MQKGKHLLIDCVGVPREVCLDDRRVLNAMVQGAEKAGATVVGQMRYHFGHNSPPGFTAVCLLDESHCSAHAYADLGLIAMDIFTCGSTDPRDVFEYIRQDLNLGQVSIREHGRFIFDEDQLEKNCVAKESDPYQSILSI